jgi:hypothetical protein
VPYREYCDAVSDLVQHLGGEPTVVELAIAEEAAGLIVWCRKARIELLKDEGRFDLPSYTAAINALRRLLGDIGQERRLRDVTPSLHTYLESKGFKKGTTE